jgi:hypothetical protein
MRRASGAVVPLVVLAVLAASLGYAAQLGEPAEANVWRPIRTLDLAYRVSTVAGSPVPPRRSTVRLQYFDSQQARVESKGDENYVAVSDAAGTHIYGRQARVLLWLPYDAALPMHDLQLSVGGNGNWEALKDHQAMTAAWLAQARAGRDGSALLPDERVAGRRCMVIRLRRSQRLVDVEYGLVLAERNDSRDSSRQFEATAVTFNGPGRAAVQRPSVPKGTPVYRGRFAAGDLEVVRNQITNSYDDELGGSVGICPGYMPRGLSGIAEREQWSGDWYSSRMYVSAAGGTIEFYQGKRVDPYVASRSRSHGATAKVVRLGRTTGTLVTYTSPYKGWLLVWQQGDANCFLDATNVPPRELIKIASAARDTGKRSYF